ncbi:MAG: nitronate monooxygenase [Planctomycetes bacterium]|nr:nitronate monooxygenase [Planctomycetota bacterium]
MYPCSNPELVAAASEAGGLGIVQPISLMYVFGHDLREGLRLIRRLTSKPIGFNVLVEKTAKVYEDRSRKWVDVALEEGVRFFITALGNPRWVVDRVHACGGIVYHDVTERAWALKALEHGVDGLICVNDRAGGHAGGKSPEQLLDELGDLGRPLVCAGGVGSPEDFVRALRLGYAAVQMGTRFIATEECRVHPDYKAAILRAEASDIVLTDKLSGVPCAVINTPYIERVGTRAGPVARWLLRGRRTKRWMRSFYALVSLWKLKGSALKGISYQDYFQAGKSVAAIKTVETAATVLRRFAEVAAAAGAGPAAETPSAAVPSVEPVSSALPTPAS